MTTEAIKEKVKECVQTIYDPELPVNIYDLGLIYEIKVSETGTVDIIMTLTAPGCPAAQSLPMEVDQKVRSVEGVTDVNVTLTWTPAWDKSMMSETAQLELGYL